MGKVRRSLRAAAAMAAVCLTFAPGAFADAPSAEDIAEARSRYKKGLDLYQEGAFEAALIELQKAYDKAPSFKILYKTALVQAQLNDYAGALRSYRRYVEEGGKKVDAKRRAEVEKEIKKLEGRVATIALDVVPDCADILVDDLVIGQSPLSDPLVVNAGKRKISASKTGYFPMARVVVVGGGDEKQLTLKLRDTSSGPPPNAAAPSSGGGSPTGPTATTPKEDATESQVPWGWWGAAAGLGAATGVAGFLTLSAEKDLDEKRGAPSTKDDLDSAATKTRTFAIVTDVLLAGTVIVGGYALYLTISGPDSEDGKDTAVQVRVGPGSLGVAGTF